MSSQPATQFNYVPASGGDELSSLMRKRTFFKWSSGIAFANLLLAAMLSCVYIHHAMASGTRAIFVTWISVSIVVWFVAYSFADKFDADITDLDELNEVQLKAIVSWSADPILGPTIASWLRQGLTLRRRDYLACMRWINETDDINATRRQYEVLRQTLGVDN